MSATSLDSTEPIEPISSGEFEFTDLERYEEIDRKHRRLAEFMATRRLDALLLQHPVNFTWFTTVAPCPQANPGDPLAALFLTSDVRLVAATNVDASYLFDRRMGGLGFQLKQRPWNESRQIVLNDLCRGRRMGLDTATPLSGAPDAVNLSAAIETFRQVLGTIERDRLKELGKAVSQAVEIAARTTEIGQTEFELTGQLAHRLLRSGIEPVRVRACVDGRTENYRNWTGSWDEVRRCVMLSATGSKDGLHCTATRTVLFGEKSSAFIEAFHKCAMLSATGIAFTRGGTTFSEIWPKVQRIYEKQGFGEEWRLADQAEITGYQPRELLLTPDSPTTIEANMAVCWHPSVGPAMVGDTVLVTAEGSEIVTPTMADWPQITIVVKGRAISLPDLLIKRGA